MLEAHIVKDTHFEEVAETKVDSKNRITLGKAKLKAGMYRVYSNSLGQIILDPLVTIPAHEQWLFKNKKALRMVQEGLEAARKGQFVKAPEDFSKYLKD